MASFVGIGCMSGSSLDGLDICCVEFTGDILSDLWGFRINFAETVEYKHKWQDRLKKANTLSGADLIKLHVDYGHFVGKSVSDFISKHDLENSVQFISSHGHSIFHQPADGFTFQLGEGEVTSTYFRVPFLCNFRCKDVSLGGEGAPLVPCGERFLFRNNDICVNLGGISNIGVKGTSGYDISPCNIVLNRLASRYDETLLYDRDGNIAQRGQLIPRMMDELESLSFYQKLPPKSLWREYIEAEVFPILEADGYQAEDVLRTTTEHIACKIADACRTELKTLRRTQNNSANILLSGGGALNKFLVERIKFHLQDSECEFDVADDMTVNFKEALIFAFLGLRCLLGEENVFSDVTGSRANTISGSIHRPMIVGKTKQISLLHH